MPNLKLDVGKTYVTRSGEEVQITANKGHHTYPFRGSNDLYYTETGVWWVGRTHSDDLVAEALASAPEHAKHKHYDLIMQWAANPALEIEYRQDSSEEWRISKAPAWIRHYQYRIKPQDKTEIRFFYADKNGAVKQGTGNRANLRLTYKNGALQTAEVI